MKKSSKIVTIFIIFAFLVVVSASRAPAEEVHDMSKYINDLFKFKLKANKWSGKIYYAIWNASKETHDTVFKYAKYYSKITGVSIEPWAREKSKRPNLAIFCGDIEFIMRHHDFKRFFCNSEYHTESEFEDLVHRVQNSRWYYVANTNAKGAYVDMYYIWSPQMKSLDVDRQVKVMLFNVLVTGLVPPKKGSVLSLNSEYEYKYLSPHDEDIIKFFYSDEIIIGAERKEYLPFLMSVVKQ